MINKVFNMPDGELVVGPKGIQVSGCYNTSSTNSRMRIGVKLVAQEELGIVSEDIDIIAMGDDAVDVDNGDEVLAKIEELGHNIKEVTYYDKLEGVEFCSHKWKENGLASPVNLGKTFHRFFSHPPLSPDYPSWYAQLSHELRNVEDIEIVMGLARQHAVAGKNIDGETSAQS
jgi:hypothetical protein